MLADLLYGIRSLRKNPAFAIVAVLTLALGIGANTAIFSVVDAVLLRRTPFTGLDRLVMIWETDRDTGTTREPASVPDFLDFQARSRTLAGTAALMAGEMNLATAGEPRRVPVLRITHGLLPLLGLQPLLGRTFSAAEDAPGGGPRVLISETLWERELARDPEVVGRTVRLDDRPWTVIGVMRRGADLGMLQILSAAAYSRSFADRGERTEIDIWAPLQADVRQFPRSTHPIFVVGRLADGVRAGAAQDEMARVMTDLERAYPENAARGAFVEPLGAVIFGPVRTAFYLLLGAVALVLIVAVVNVACLLLARGTARAHEVAVRRALGAGTAKLTRLFLVESLLLTLASTGLGVALAYTAVRAIVALAPADVPRVASAAVDLRVLSVTLVVSVAIAFGFGLFPLIQVRRAEPQGALKEGTGRSSRGSERKRLHQALVAAELALAVVLVSGAALLINSFWRLQSVEPGFRAEGVLKAEYQLPAVRYPSDFRRWPDFAEQHAFTRALLARASALPGVRTAAIAGNHPLDPGFTNSFTIVGREAEARTWPEISCRQVSPGYFPTVGLPLLRGRLLSDGDTTTGAPVVVINEAAAQRFFPSQDPVGAQMRFWGTSRRIVGVVGNERFHGLADAPPVAAYTPLSQTPSATGVLLLQTSLDPMSLASSATRTIHEIDPALAVFAVEPLDRTVARSMSQRRFTTWLLGSFAALALLLAAIGVHGLLSYTVARRRQEFGIRIALGAGRGSVLGLVLREGLAVIAGGLVCGLAASVVLTRGLRALLFGVTPTDPLTFAAVVATLAVAGLAATVIPARRASHVDPLTALRSD
jgi:putative ABC transport system permease protein